MSEENQSSASAVAVQLNDRYRQALVEWRTWIEGGTTSRDRDQNRPLKLTLYGLARQIESMVERPERSMMSPSSWFPVDLAEEKNTRRTRDFEAALFTAKAEVEARAEALISHIESNAFLSEFDMFDHSNEIVIGFLSGLIGDLGQSDTGADYIGRSLAYDPKVVGEDDPMVPIIHLARFERALGVKAKIPESDGAASVPDDDRIVDWFLWGFKHVDKTVFKNAARLHQARMDLLVKSMPWLFRRAAMEADWAPALGGLLTWVAKRWYGGAALDFENDDLMTMAMQIEDFVETKLERVDGETVEVLETITVEDDFDVLAQWKYMIAGARLFAASVKAYVVINERAGQDMTADDMIAVARVVQGLASATTAFVDQWDGWSSKTVPRLTYMVGDVLGTAFKYADMFEGARKSAEGMFDASADYDSVAMAGHTLGLSSAILPAALMIGGVAAGPAGWLALGLSLTGTGILYFANDDPLVTWTRRMWFGKGARARAALRPDQIAFRFKKGDEHAELSRCIGRLLGILYPTRTRASLRLRGGDQPRSFKKYEMDMRLEPTYPMPLGTIANIRVIGDKSYEKSLPWSYKSLGSTGDPESSPATQLGGFVSEGEVILGAPVENASEMDDLDFDQKVMSYRTGTLEFDVSERKFDEAYIEIEWVLPPDAPLDYMAQDIGARMLPEAISVPLYSYKYLRDIELSTL